MDKNYILQGFDGILLEFDMDFNDILQGLNMGTGIRYNLMGFYKDLKT